MLETSMSNTQLSPLALYQGLVARKEVSFDPAQQQALLALDELQQQLNKPGQHDGLAASGLYLWGKVGPTIIPL